MNKTQRQKRYIDPKVQGALVARLVFHWLIFVVAAFLLLCVWQVLVSGDPVNFGKAISRVWRQNLPVMVAVLVMLPVFVLDTIKLSHRFAGPVLRLRETLRDWGDGKQVEPLTIRRGDYWSELADIFNRVLDRYGDPRPDAQQSGDESREPAEVTA